jgi:hydrogenase maturation protein HypF
MIADQFHATIVEMIVRGCRRIRERTGLTRVALSGGCFVNSVLVEGAIGRLEAEGFEVLLRRIVPPNDGGIALGQVAVAAARLC